MLKSMLKILAAIVFVLIAGVLILAATRPDSFRVERATTIQAPPEKVFALIGDFGHWESWSPWDKKDPAMQRRFSASTSGKGARYDWQGNKEVGKGSMEIIEALPPSRLLLNLDFEMPFEAHNTVIFTLTPRAGATDVSWAMEGPVPYLAKIMHLFFDMDKLVGGDFEAGLANMKALAEK